MLRESTDKKELLLYAGLWTILFLAPIPGIYIHYANSQTEEAFRWDDIYMVWFQYAAFLVAFLLHNFLLAPLLVYSRKRVLYFAGFAVLLAAFVTIQCSHRPEEEGRPMHEKEAFRPPFPHRGGERRQTERDFDEQRQAEGHDFEERPEDHRGPDGPFRQEGHRPPVFIGEHDVVAVIIFLLMLGLNLGVKYYFRHRQDHERLQALKRENLEQQLEYLKYQINPHFLMNTLNNIHALVDIDPEQAKETIVELSKILRFLLYEGSKQKVPLRQELIFLDNYIHLMQMRVAEQVDIKVDITQVIPDYDIPPLMLITFVENAFKHGVSYQQHSFIDISIRIEDNHLLFHCANSKVPQGEDHHGGVGLQNVRRRLQLIYGSNYTLRIQDQADTYTVDLALPL